MANTSITVVPNMYPGTPGIIVTWIGGTPIPPNMKIQISNTDTSGLNWYGGWYAYGSNPYGVNSVNPTMGLASQITFPIDLTKGPLWLAPNWGSPIGTPNAGAAFASINTPQTGPNVGIQATAIPPVGISTGPTNLTIVVIGGGGGEE